MSMSEIIHDHEQWLRTVSLTSRCSQPTLLGLPVELRAFQEATEALDVLPLCEKRWERDAGIMVHVWQIFQATYAT